MTDLLSIDHLLRTRQFDAAVRRMQEACAIYSPLIPVDAEQVRAAYEATRDQLKAEVPPEPFRVRVMYTNPVKPGGAR